MRRLTLLASLVTLLFFAAPRDAAAVPFVFVGPGALNVDSNPATTVNLFANVAGPIADLNIFVEIAGGHMEDFDLFLTAPDGTMVHFRSDFTNPFFHIDSPLFATFDDEAVLPHSAQQFGANGTFQPFNPLSAFDGHQLMGIWTLSISDTFIPNEGNILVTWRISGEVVPEPATMVLVGSGIAAAALRRRRRVR